MSDEATMRLRLQNVAAYRELCRGVRRSGRENVVFAFIMIGLAFYSFRPNAGGFATVVFLLYLALALAEFAVGLFKLLFPTAEGVLLDALVLLLFAGWNLGWQGLALVAGVQPNGVIIFIGLYMLLGTLNRFKSYLTLRRLFAERPSAEHIAWFDDLVFDIRASDPHIDPLALDLPTRPHWRAKLLGGTAFFVTVSGHSVWVAGPEDFTLKREAADHGTGQRRAFLSIHGEGYPEFELEDVSWTNYTKWIAAQFGDRV
ncbi:hypothetical protein [Frigoriglobus tundricola]|uniref:Uncharacterized protein n=1 Tax=Frigoriglobus tundricola TaxID=2774151 RepID=A0A6M5YX74_9BACT|nr:hypothetical protein [Frigoriglobus tundricola]QJW98110.1 hypothetical protein FTUN_5690 [Frigoriglobus tundricola]